jgi:sec-independent protein translocase protein TatC
LVEFAGLVWHYGVINPRFIRWTPLRGIANLKAEFDFAPPVPVAPSRPAQSAGPFMPSRDDQNEDLFADSRMSFGEHIEELRTHLIRAIKGLLFCLVIGFVLDGIGWALDMKWIGIGRPMFDVITRPVKQQLIAFYDRRLEKLKKDALEKDSDALAATQPRTVRMRFSPEARAALTGQPVVPGSDPIEVPVDIAPVDLFEATKQVQNVVRPPELSALSVTETFVVYFKVSLLCGFVLACPWVFYQVWSFVAAGLYHNEKRLVHVYLPTSVGLFLGGVVLCQFAVIPQSIEALLWFNEWLGVAPDLRLSEWLSFAIILPLLFGLSFQTPLVMFVLEQIGIVSIATYWAYWRISVFMLGVFAALITPTPDAITWFCMWAPLVGLYFLGIGLCMLARRRDPDYEVPETDELVEV